MDAAINILHYKTQDSLIKLIAALQQEALRQEDQLKVIRALEPDYECASQLPGVGRSLRRRRFWWALQSHFSLYYRMLTRAWRRPQTYYPMNGPREFDARTWSRFSKSHKSPTLSVHPFVRQAQHIIYAMPDVYSICKLRADIGCTLEWDVCQNGFKRARKIQGISKDALWYSHLAVAAMERMEERDLPKVPQSFADLVVVRLKGLNLFVTGIWPRWPQYMCVTIYKRC